MTQLLRVVALVRGLGILLAANVFEGIALAGLAVLLYGCSLVWQPLPYLVAGTVLSAFGLWGAVPWASLRR